MIRIAVDGPASSGKGTVARRVASELGYTYVDTGAMYRAVGLRVLRLGGDVTRAEDAVRAVQGLELSFRWEGGVQRTLADGEDVSEAIRSERVGTAASAVAVHPGVRAALLGLQQAMGAAGGIVMDGRDIGTVVLPAAELKIYLDASVDERARRRQRDLPGARFEEVRRDLLARDAQDAGRATAPLRRAEDAVHVDSTELGPDEVVACILQLARARGA